MLIMLKVVEKVNEILNCLLSWLDEHHPGSLNQSITWNSILSLKSFNCFPTHGAKDDVCGDGVLGPNLQMVLAKARCNTSRSNEEGELVLIPPDVILHQHLRSPSTTPTFPATTGLIRNVC